MTFPGLPPQASAHAPEIDFVLGLEHWGILALFAFYRMRGFLNVKSDADYHAYLAEEARSRRR